MLILIITSQNFLPIPLSYHLYQTFTYSSGTRGNASKMIKIIETPEQSLLISYRCSVQKTKNHSRVIQLRVGVSVISFTVITK